MRKQLMVSVVLLLVACNDSSSVKMVQSQRVAADDKTTLGEFLDRRPVCDKTVWTETAAQEKGGEASVDYQCVLSATQTQVLFDAQWAAWVARYQQRLTAAEALKTAVLAKKDAETSPALLDTAHQVFTQLQASGDLVRFKALVQDSPVHNQPLDAVNVFFASEKGQAYLATTQGEAASAAQAALAKVTEAITAAGLATRSQDIDVCKTPALLVLAVILTPQEVEKGFGECRTSLTSRYDTELASADSQIAEVQTRLEKLKMRPALVGVTEVITWRVPTKGEPTTTAHTFELDVRQGDSKEARRFTKSLGLTDMASVVSGDFNNLYQDMQISVMSDLVR